MCINFRLNISCASLFCPKGRLNMSCAFVFCSKGRLNMSCVFPFCLKGRLNMSCPKGRKSVLCPLDYLCVQLIYYILSCYFPYLSCLATICPVLSIYVLELGGKSWAFGPAFLSFFWIESVLWKRICPGSWIQRIHVISNTTYDIHHDHRKNYSKLFAYWF